MTKPQAAKAAPAPAGTPVKDRLKAAKLPTRTVDICLHTDLQAEWEAADAELREAVAVGTLDKRLNSGAKQRELAQRVEDLQVRMREHVLPVTLQALSKRAWNDLLSEHPPRDDNKEDAAAGLNVDTFFDAAIRACTISPEMDDEDWALLLEERTTAGQYGELQNAMMALNVRKVDVPNSYAASRVLRGSAPE